MALVRNATSPWPLTSSANSIPPTAIQLELEKFLLYFGCVAGHRNRTAFQTEWIFERIFHSKCWINNYRFQHGFVKSKKRREENRAELIILITDSMWEEMFHVSQSSIDDRHSSPTLNQRCFMTRGANTPNSARNEDALHLIWTEECEYFLIYVWRLRTLSPTRIHSIYSNLVLLCAHVLKCINITDAVLTQPHRNNVMNKRDAGKLIVSLWRSTWR